MSRNVLGIFSKVFASNNPADREELTAFEDGWDSDYSSPVSGKKPERKAFNDLFAKLTAVCVDVNVNGGCLPWDPNITYGVNAVVTPVGSTGMYQSTSASNTGNDPVSSPSEWEKLPSSTDLSDHVTDDQNPHGVTAEQANAVDKGGDQMTGPLRVSSKVTLDPSDQYGIELASDAFIGGDLTGNTRGQLAIDIQGDRANIADIASGGSSVALGNLNRAQGQNSVAIGRDNNNDSASAVVIGTGNDVDATSPNAVVLGSNNIATGTSDMVVIGSGCIGRGTNGYVIGQSVESYGTNAGAIGVGVFNDENDVQEIGQFTSGARDMGIKLQKISNGVGLVSMTLPNRAAKFGDGGASSGDEALTEIMREGFAVRRDGDDLYIDVNIGGTVKTVSLGTAV